MAYMLAVPAARRDPADMASGTRSATVSCKRSAAGEIHPVVKKYALIGDAYRAEQCRRCSINMSILSRMVRQRTADRSETDIVRISLQPSRVPSPKAWRFTSLRFFSLAFPGWLEPALNRSAFYLLLLALAIHTFGLVSRMYLQERPPVTNLYSSAIFIGWGAVIVALILERIFRDGIGAACAGAIGFITLIIAHHLAGSGDTLEMLQAVLDTNIWLATHVVAITTGYSAMFLAGMLAIIYVIRGVFTRSLKKETADSLARMTYGVVCFATLFSFVGTVLGGIWADQSWGRFWGWDPKENGAVLIVLWCAIILHARWGGFIRQRGLMIMAIFGNVVTSFSWFGVNMLGVGLHSYGFMQKAFPWLVGFMLSQLALMAIAAMPLERWRSFRTPAGSPSKTAGLRNDIYTPRTSRNNQSKLRNIMKGISHENNRLHRRQPACCSATSLRAAARKHTGTNCAQCHGKTGSADTKMGKKLSAKDLTDPKVQAAFTDAKATQSIKEGVKENGKTTMKAFGGKLTDDEIKALVAYVRA